MYTEQRDLWSFYFATSSCYWGKVSFTIALCGNNYSIGQLFFGQENSCKWLMDFLHPTGRL